LEKRLDEFKATLQKIEKKSKEIAVLKEKPIKNNDYEAVKRLFEESIKKINSMKTLADPIITDVTSEITKARAEKIKIEIEELEKEFNENIKRLDEAIKDTVRKWY